MAPIEHLYVHVPFCPKLCPYCCFYVEEGSRNKNRAFLDALLLELEVLSQRRPVVPRTIYFGGGTPTALLADQLEYLLLGMRQRLPLEHLEEWSVEANPATVRPEKARILKEAGVTRVSLGVQSWSEKTLKTLGRVHSSAQARATYETLRSSGFQTLNLDLMFSVPGQTASDWEKDLATTLELRPDHVSAYCLTYEEDTEYFEKLCGGTYQQDDTLDAQLFEHTMDRLGEAGYRHYEISNHALPGAESRHNQACWEGREYAGLGPSAFSTLDGERTQNVCDTAAYVQRVAAGGSPVESRELLSEPVLRKERMAFGLRRAEGVMREDLLPWSSELAHLQEIGLLESFGERGERMRLTRRGKLLADSVGESFM